MTDRRFGRLILRVPLLVVLALMWAPIGASASEGSHWSGPIHLPGGDRAGVPTSVSCASPTACRAVDSQGNASTYDGSTWSPVHDVVGHYGSLASVSCPTAEFCAAVGGRRAVTRTADGWGRLHVLPIQRMFAVSCASRHFCLALGAPGFADPVRRQALGGDHIGTPAHLTSVSCVSRTFCLACRDGDAYRYDGQVGAARARCPRSAAGGPSPVSRPRSAWS